MTHWVVLDDLDTTWDDDSVETPALMLRHFVETDATQGMSAENAARALEILQTPCEGPLPKPRMYDEVLDTPSSPEALCDDDDIIKKTAADFADDLIKKTAAVSF